MHRGWHSRGYLPHLDAPGELQVLTFRLGDALPKQVVERWREELRLEPESAAAMELGKRIARYEDAGYGESLLKIAQHAEAVEGCLLHADGVKYRLLDWCVMPNHVHAMIGTVEGVKLGDIVRSWKTYSAKLINGWTGQTGALWEEDYHDRYIREESHFHSARSYIRNNPVRAGLCQKPEEWPWSSASRATG
jgi:REP element-mobilizing transposase RayT